MGSIKIQAPPQEPVFTQARGQPRIYEQSVLVFSKARKGRGKVRVSSHDCQAPPNMTLSKSSVFEQAVNPLYAGPRPPWIRGLRCTLGFHETFMFCG